jgi:hypothetical protein
MIDVMDITGYVTSVTRNVTRASQVIYKHNK